MGKQHLNFLALVARGRELRCSGQLTCLIARLFMDAAQDVAGCHVRTALRLELAGLAVLLRRTILANAVMSAVDARYCVIAPELLQGLARRTGVLVQHGIEAEVRAAKRAVVTAALVPDR